MSHIVTSDVLWVFQTGCSSWVCLIWNETSAIRSDLRTWTWIFLPISLKWDFIIVQSNPWTTNHKQIQNWKVHFRTEVVTKFFTIPIWAPTPTHFPLLWEHIFALTIYDPYHIILTFLTIVQLLNTFVRGMYKSTIYHIILIGNVCIYDCSNKCILSNAFLLHSYQF